MKTNNYKEVLKNVFKVASFFAVSTAMMMFIAACGSNGGGGNANVGPGVVYPNCPTCNPNSSFLASGAGCFCSSGGISFELALELYGDGQMGIYGQQPYANGQPYYQQPMIGNYSGMVSGQGILTVLNVPYMSCNIPPGTYTVQTQQPGQFQGQSLGGLRLMATGPSQLEIIIDNWGAWLSSAIPSVQTMDGRQFPYKLQGLVWIRNVGGYMQPQPYPGYPPQYGNGIACDFRIE